MTINYCFIITKMEREKYNNLKLKPNKNLFQSRITFSLTSTVICLTINYWKVKFK